VVAMNRHHRIRVALAFGLCWLSLSAASRSLAATKEPEGPITMDVRLMAADLVDEMVYSWQDAPPLSGKAKLVLADIAAPVGLDERFNVLVENRIFELLRQNPGIPVELSHCGPCTRWVAKSNPQGTILGRGIDQPEILAQILHDMPERQALSLDFEAEGRELVLRAQIYELTASQRILWAQTFSTSLSARRVLREANPLLSLAEAREQQRQILAGRDPIEISSRLAIRSFNNRSSAPVSAVPLPFFEQSVESVPLPKRSIRAGVTVGFTSIKDSLSAWTVGGHVMGLMFRDKPSLIAPDLYWTFGAQYIRMRGPGAASFAQGQTDLDTLRNTTAEPRATLVAYRLGLEVHIKYRMGLLAFIEDIPILKDNDSVEQKSLLGIPYHCIGGGVVVRW